MQLRQKVRSYYLSNPMIEPLYRHKLANNSWQGWADSIKTFDDKLTKVDESAIREIIISDEASDGAVK
jgi:hypothetical protein